MKRVLALIVSLATLLCLAACGGGGSGSGSNSGSGDTDKVYNLTFSLHTPADTPVGRHFQAMLDEIEENTAGPATIPPDGRADPDGQQPPELRPGHRGAVQPVPRV